MRRTLFLFAGLAIFSFVNSCGNTSNGGGGTPPPTASSVTVAPDSLSLNKGGMQTFTATVNGTTDQSVFWEIVEATPKTGDSTHGFISTGGVFIAAVTGNANQLVTWQVNGMTGGGPQTGTISTTGLFRAPNSVPVLTSGNNSGQTTQVAVTAISQADATAADSVLVTIVPPQQNAQGANSPLGVSGGNAKDSSTVSGQTLCCGGTLGALVSRGSNQYILSNNHVLARSDAGTAGTPTVGDPIVQPGLIDNNCSMPPTVATLSQFFNMESGPAPKIDAALAQINTGAVDTAGTILQLS